MKIKEVISYLNKIAPPSYQESYDNAGLITGNPNWEIKGIITCLDAIEAVVEEAIEKECNLIIAHHPIIFKGLKKINGSNYVERTIIKAIKKDIAIFAIHTNLDNVLYKGVNTKIATRLGLKQLEILSPKKLNKTTSFFIAKDAIQDVASLIAQHHLELETIKPEEVNTPLQNIRITFDAAKENIVRNIFSHYSNSSASRLTIWPVDGRSKIVGSGIIGTLTEAMAEKSFLKFLKDRMQVNCIRHTQLLEKPIQKVAICGGAGSFLLPRAISKRADIFITADYKYHEFFDADRKLIIADIGHYESEQFTIDLLYEIISETFSNFTIYKTSIITNPVFYM